MATYDVDNITRVPCRILVNGSQIGVCRAIRFYPNVRYENITAEEFGHTPNKVIYIGQSPIVACIVRDYDQHAFNTLFPNNGTGNILTPKTASNMTTVSVTIQPLHAAHPGVTFPNAVPQIAAASALQFGYNTDIGLAAVFAALPDSNGDFYTVG